MVERTLLFFLKIVQCWMRKLCISFKVKFIYICIWKTPYIVDSNSKQVFKNLALKYSHLKVSRDI